MIHASIADWLTNLNRFSIGFDDIANRLASFDATAYGVVNYPPFNIRKLTATDYAIELAVAGFEQDDLNIAIADNLLSVSTVNFDEQLREQPKAKPFKEFLYQGIARRAFARSFELAEHVEVVSASLQDGILSIKLTKTIPPEKLPRKIYINSDVKPSGPGLLNEGKAA